MGQLQIKLKLQKTTMKKEENQEPKKDKVLCRNCGNDTWRVYCTVIIDDTRLYCAKCGKEWY